MITLKREEKSLAEVLKNYLGSKIFIDIEVPENDFKEIKGYTRHTKGKVKSLTVTMYTKEEGKQDIHLDDGKDIPKELKEFLEKEYLIAYKMDFDISIMLNCGIKLNIQDDINVLLQMNESKENRVAKQERIFKELGIDKDKLIRDENVYELLEKIYTKYSEEFKEEEYIKAFEIRKQLTYTGYFGIYTDKDLDKASMYLKYNDEMLEEIDKEILDKYKFKVSSPYEVRRYLNDNIGLDRTFKKELITASKEHKEYSRVISSILKHRELNKEKILLRKNNKMYARVNNIYQTHGLNQIMLKGMRYKLDMYKTDERKSYYISIDAGNIYNKYFEKVKNKKIITTDTDYNIYIASRIYGVPEESITKEHIQNIKLYNFSRYLAGLEKLKGKKLLQFTEEQKNILGEIKLKNRGRIRNFEPADILDTNKLVYDKLAKLCKRLNNRGDFGIIISYLDLGDNYIFKVSNNLNPYEVTKLILDELDTTEDIGIRLYDNISIGNNLKELQENEAKLDITYKKILEKVLQKGNIKFRNVVKEVEKDFIEGTK